MNKFYGRNDAMYLSGLSRGQITYLAQKNIIKPARSHHGYSLNQLIWLGVFKAFLDKGLAHSSIIKIFEKVFGNINRFDDFDLSNYSVLEVSDGKVTLSELNTDIIKKFDETVDFLASQNLIEKDGKVIGNISEMSNYIEINGRLFILIYRIYNQIYDRLEAKIQALSA